MHAHGLHEIGSVAQSSAPCILSSYLPHRHGWCSTPLFIILTITRIAPAPVQVLHRIVNPERVEYARDQTYGLQIYSTEKSFVVLFPSASELEAWRRDLRRPTSLLGVEYVWLKYLMRVYQRTW